MALTGGAIVLYYNTQKDEKLKEVTKNVVTVGKPALGGPFALIDSNGEPKTDASYRGKFMLLYFGFTRCPDICPSELVKVGKILDLLGKSSLITPKPISAIFNHDFCLEQQRRKATVAQLNRFLLA